MVGGVCGGLAASLHIDAAILRVAAIVLAATGPGIPVYLIAWLVMPRPLPEAGTGASHGDTTLGDTPTRRGVGLGLLVLGSVLFARQLGLAPPDPVTIPVLVIGLGLGVVIWQYQPRVIPDRWVAARIAAGVVVLGMGVAAFVAGNVSVSVVRNGLFAVLLVIGGLGLILGPWIAVLIRSRQEERRERLRADARTDMAAHLHDSVLQTFAMIQRSDDPRQMSSLARRQERELRRWLYGGGDRGGDLTLKTAVEGMAAGVEDLHGVVVESVVVGDTPITPGIEALLSASGEAATNSAKWSGCDRVSVFVEAADNGVHAYVRDTGSGFDPESVAPDRLGLRESIHGRMERAGGSADVVTGAGQGTEVHLFLPVS